MPTGIQSWPIPKFSGLELEVSPTDQERGTLRRADGINTAPIDAISFGAYWRTGWNRTTLGADIVSALSGATANKVHFVTLTRSSTTFLIAYNLTSNRPRGIWHVAGTGDPALTAASGSSITATSGTVYRDKTTALNWYGSWIDDQLWLGNGTDVNLVWASGALGFLGPQTTPTDANDISQVAFPPCRSWVENSVGIRYGAGNTTNPFRVWASELPNKNYPKPQGIRTTALSFTDIQPSPGATLISSLSIIGESLIAHFDVGSPMILLRTDNSKGGWKFDQRPMEANAGAMNPNCARDSKIAPMYFGSDLEIYTPKQRVAYNKSDFRDTDIVTKRSAGMWNSAMTKPQTSGDQAVIYAEKTGRAWIWATASAGSRSVVYCYDERTFAVTGPWRYPDFLSVCQLRDETLNGTLVAGITRDGVFLWADVDAIGELPTEAYATAIGAAYAPVLVAPTPDPGIGYVGVDATNSKFSYTLNGQTLYMADPWSDWSTSGSFTPTVYFNNARVAVLEISETNLGEPAIWKEIFDLRALWTRNSRVYVGAYAEVNSYRYGKYRGTLYPYIDQLYGLGGEGVTCTIRLVIVSFNSQAAVMQAAMVDFGSSVMA
jgi:hypothetical protein